MKVKLKKKDERFGLLAGQIFDSVPYVLDPMSKVMLLDKKG